MNNCTKISHWDQTISSYIRTYFKFYGLDICMKFIKGEFTSGCNFKSALLTCAYISPCNLMKGETAYSTRRENSTTATLIKNGLHTQRKIYDLYNASL